jgi:hypothetical protein
MEEERVLVKMRWIRTVTYCIVVMQRVGLHFKLLITPCSRDMIIAWRWRRVVGSTPQNASRVYQFMYWHWQRNPRMPVVSQYVLYHVEQSSFSVQQTLTAGTCHPRHPSITDCRRSQI